MLNDVKVSFNNFGSFQIDQLSHEKIELASHDVPIRFDIFLYIFLICEETLSELFWGGFPPTSAFNSKVI